MYIHVCRCVKYKQISKNILILVYKYGGYGCRISKPLTCICTLSYGGVTQLEVSIPHGECFQAAALNCKPWNSVPLKQ